MQVAAHEAKLGHGKLAEELRGLLQRSHQLVVSKLPKRTQIGLLLGD